MATVSSGNIRLALFDGSSNLLAQSAAQPAYSGTNYFTFQPSFVTVSGANYMLGFMGDATNSSGFYNWERLYHSTA